MTVENTVEVYSVTRAKWKQLQISGDYQGAISASCAVFHQGEKHGKTVGLCRTPGLVVTSLTSSDLPEISQPVWYCRPSGGRARQSPTADISLTTDN